MVRPISNPVSADASSWISLIDATQRFGIDVNLVGKLEAGEHEKNRPNNSTFLTQQPERCENNDPIFVMHDAAISMATCSCCCCCCWVLRSDTHAMKFLIQINLQWSFWHSKVADPPRVEIHSLFPQRIHCSCIGDWWESGWVQFGANHTTKQLRSRRPSCIRSVFRYVAFVRHYHAFLSATHSRFFWALIVVW